MSPSRSVAASSQGSRKYFDLTSGERYPANELEAASKAEVYNSFTNDLRVSVRRQRVLRVQALL